MELPEFDAPDTKSQPKPPEVAVVGVGQPGATAPPALAQKEVSEKRRWLTLAGLFAAPLILGLGLMFFLKSTPTPPEVQEFAKNADPSATKDGQAMVVKREAERIAVKYNMVKNLLARSRSVHGNTKDVRNLEYALAQVDGMIRLKAYEQADRQLEQIKGSIPAVPVKNPLEAAPKPIDVKAPPKALNEDPTPIAPASAQRGAVRTNSPRPTAITPTPAPAPAKKKKRRTKRRQ